MTRVFRDWLEGLRDGAARQRIAARITRLSGGNVGMHRVLSGGVGELKVDHGPGYRLYFAWRGAALVILLSGGDKRTQQRDIQRAIAMAKEEIDT